MPTLEWIFVVLGSGPVTKTGAVWRPFFWGRLLSLHMIRGHFSAPEIWRIFFRICHPFPSSPSSPSPFDRPFLDRFLFLPSLFHSPPSLLSLDPISLDRVCSILPRIDCCLPWFDWSPYVFGKECGSSVTRTSMPCSKPATASQPRFLPWLPPVWPAQPQAALPAHLPAQALTPTAL